MVIAPASTKSNVPPRNLKVGPVLKKQASTPQNKTKITLKKSILETPKEEDYENEIFEKYEDEPKQI
jgi:hypothetical protein